MLAPIKPLSTHSSFQGTENNMYCKGCGHIFCSYHLQQDSSSLSSSAALSSLESVFCSRAPLRTLGIAPKTRQSDRSTPNMPANRYCGWYCGWCRKGSFSLDLDDHCCFCYRQRDPYATMGEVTIHIGFGATQALYKDTFSIKQQIRTQPNERNYL